MTEYVRKNGSREFVEVAAGQGTTMQVLISSEEAPNFAFRKFVMEPHGGMPKHTNLVEHEQYVLRGSGVIEIAGNAYEITAGDSVFIPSKVPHSYIAGKDGLEFICIVPNKEDKVEVVE
ncbi:MAG: cupin domain-containing protein [Candidatus Thiodiazotropha sp.]|nr:cupin domain-containing protein [Candidatus Thiodiazotropha sp.]MCM8885231.1 cupin domain-containing protein [Candidatus Thiodiazotropha sp.]MCM8921019.1 cupin domain-containing protein [Candidatus Thiodiazotropha sp.]